MADLLTDNLYDEELEFLTDESESFWSWWEKAKKQYPKTTGVVAGGLRGLGGAAGSALGGAAGNWLANKYFNDSNAAKVAGTILGATVGRGIAGGFLDREMEWELSSDEILSPRQKYDNNRLMEYLGYAAANTANQAEAEAFVGALVPLAARLNSRTAPIMKRSSPGFIGGLSAATKLLHRNRRTRPLIRTFPTILRHTSATINRQLKEGKNVTPKKAVNTLANQTYRVMKSPQQIKRALSYASRFNGSY